MGSDTGSGLEETPQLFSEWLCTGASAKLSEPCAKPALHAGTGLNDARSSETHVVRTWVRPTKATRVQEGQGWGLRGRRAACSKPRAPVRTGWESHRPHQLLFRASRGTFCPLSPPGEVCGLHL